MKKTFQNISIVAEVVSMCAQTGSTCFFVLHFDSPPIFFHVHLPFDPFFVSLSALNCFSQTVAVRCLLTDFTWGNQYAASSFFFVSAWLHRNDKIKREREKKNEPSSRLKFQRNRFNSQEISKCDTNEIHRSISIKISFQDANLLRQRTKKRERKEKLGKPCLCSGRAKTVLLHWNGGK